MLTPEVFREIVVRGKSHGLPVVGHVPLMVDALEASDAGLRSFEHLRNIDFACSSKADSLREERTKTIMHTSSKAGMQLRSEIHWSQRPVALATYDKERCRILFEHLARNGTWQVPTLITSTREVLRPDTVARIRATLRYVPASSQTQWEAWSSRTSKLSAVDAAVRARHTQWLFQLTRDMQRAGIGLLAGTDISGPWIVPGFSLHEELLDLVRAGLSPLQALQAATINPARFLGSADSLGTVAAGKLADLVILSGNPLEDIKNTQQIEAVVLNGRYLDSDALSKLLSDAESAAKH
jgi:imidazolonepropionase-like amidohydrolase